MAQKSHSPESYTIGWIAALAHELAAATAMLDEEHERPAEFQQNARDDNQYTWGRMDKHNIVIASLPAGEYGTSVAAVTATSMGSSLPWIRIGLLVGIGAGVPKTTPEADIRLGDVVVSIPKGSFPGVIQYDLAKVKEGEIRPTGHLNKAPPAIRNAVAKLQARNDLYDSKIPELLAAMWERYPKLARNSRKKPGYVHQGFREDVFYRDGKIMQRDLRESSDPEVHYGTIASGNMLLKDSKERDLILQRLEGSESVMCFEMEAGGLMNNFPCLVVRGICDYADEHKNDMWQKYAAATAAAYAKELLIYVDAAEVQQTTKIEEVINSIRDVKEHSSRILSAVQVLQEASISSEIGGWLKTSDPSTNYNQALSQRHPGSGAWLLRSTSLANWKKDPHSFLWLHGAPGCGKTILSTAIIDHLDEEHSEHLLLYFYFDFKDPDKQTIASMARSLISQCCASSAKASNHVRQLFDSHASGAKQLSTEALYSALSNLLDMAGPVRIILDALDECTKRQHLFQWLEQLLSGRSKNVQLLATSRREADIDSALRAFTRPGEIVEIQPDSINGDIRSYVQGHIGDRKGKLYRWRNHPKVQHEIMSTLMGKANGMFRWAACQIEALHDCEDLPDLREALESLPNTLVGTYDRVLEKIPLRKRKRVTRLLQFLAYSEQPLRLEEAVDAVAVSLEQESFSEDNRLPDPGEITLYCSTFVLLVERQDEAGRNTWAQDTDVTLPVKELQLAHLSVKEYLTCGGIQASFREDMAEFTARSSIAKVTLTYLLALDNSLPPAQIVRDFPLSLYAARFGIINAGRLNAEDKHVIRLVTTLFDPRNGTYTLWRSLYEADRPREMYPWQRNAIDLDHPSSPPSPLYFASMLNLAPCVSRLLEQGAHVDARGGLYGNALQAASWGGHESVVRLLLDVNADIHAQGGEYGSALSAASAGGHSSVVQLLLDRGSNVNFVAGDGKSALHLAAIHGHVGCARLLLEREANSFIDDENMTPFLYAVERSSEEVAATILEFEPQSIDLPIKRHRRTHSQRQVDLSTIDTPGLTSLHYAVLSANSRMARYVLREGANANASTEHGKTALHFCVNTAFSGTSATGIQQTGEDFDVALPYEDQWTQCQPEVVLDYLDPDPDSPGKEEEYQSTKTAIEEARIKVLRILLDHNIDSPEQVDIDARDHEGKSPVQYLAADVNPGKSTMLQMLCESGADLRTRDSKGVSPLHQAFRWSNLRAVQILLNHRIDLTAVDDEGKTIVHYAAQSGDSTTLLCALEVLKRSPGTTSQITASDNHGRSPLHQLLEKAWNTDKEAVEVLLATDMDVNAVDADGHTPLSTYFIGFDLFGPDGNDGIIELLLKRGASVSAFRDPSQRTLLHLAAARSSPLSLKVVSTLEHAGMQISDLDADQRTLIHHSALNGGLTFEVLQYLESHGLQRDARDRYGKSALDYANEMDRKFAGTMVFNSERWGQVANLLQQSLWPPTSWIHASASQLRAPRGYKSLDLDP